MAVYEPGGEISPGPDSDDTLVLDFQPLEREKINFCVKALSVWYFGMAARAD